MIIAIQNTIGALARRASTAASIITQNLQMWLGFTKADVIGAELVSDGDFLLTGTQAASVTGDYWQTGSAWTIGSGSAHYDGISSGSELRQYPVSPSLSAGTTLLLSFTISNVQAGKTAFFKIEVSGVPISVFGYTNFNEGVHQFTYTLSGSQDRILIVPLTSGTGGTFSISDVTIKEVAQFAPDKSNNSNNAKLFTGKALSFDGVNDKVDFTSVSLNGEFTIAVWFKVGGGVENWIGNDADGIANSYFNGGNSLAFNINHSTATFSFPSFTNIYSRLVVTRDSSNNVRVYVNGIESTSGSFVKSGVFKFDTIGRERTSYGDITLSDFQIYNTAWDSDDVAYDYANPNNLVIDNPDATITKSNLIGYWALSEGSGSIAYDSSGEGNNGAITGATYVLKQPTIPQLGMVDWAKSTPVSTVVTLIEAPNDLGKDILGNALRLRDGGFNLDGSGYGSIASDATLTAITNGTIQFWLKTSTTKFSVLNGQSNSEFIGQTDNGVWTDGNSGTITAYKDGSTASTSPVYDGAWHFYTFTGVNLSAWTSFLISNLTAFELDCIVDEVLIYDDVLTATEIDNNFNVSSATHS